MSLVVKAPYYSIPPRQLFNDITSGAGRYYVAIGRVQPWLDEEAPPIPFDNLKTELETRRSIAACKRISASDIYFGIRRVNWTLGTVYDFWDDEIGLNTIQTVDEAYVNTMKQRDFYVMTNENNVYKCIWNNYGAPSTIQPTGSPIRTFTTSDGYKWKFMFKLSPLEVETFLTDDTIPIKLFTSLNGAIESVLVTNTGSGYTSTPDAEIVGDGQGATAVAFVDGGEVTGFLLTSSGFGYTNAEVVITGGGVAPGNEASAVALISFDSSLQRIVQDAAVPGSIEHAILLTSGQGYVGQPTANIVGDGYDATAEVIMNNIVSEVQINLAGFDYIDPPTLTFIGGGGSGATAEAIVQGGSIVDVVVTNSGTGYTSAPDIIITPAPSGGQGAQLTAVMQSDGLIKAVEMTNVGYGYTQAFIQIVPDQNFPNSGFGASARPIMSPIGGHGSQAFRELYADRIISSVYIDFKNDFDDIFLNNEFRQISVLRNPTKYNTEEFFALDDTLNASFTAVASDVTDLQDDDILTNYTTTFAELEYIKFRVVTIRDNQVFLQHIGYRLPPMAQSPDTVTLTCVRNGLQYTLTNFVVPELDVFSGEILYTENRLSLLRVDGQVENIKAVFDFSTQC